MMDFQEFFRRCGNIAQNQETFYIPGCFGDQSKKIAGGEGK